MDILTSSSESFFCGGRYNQEMKLSEMNYDANLITSTNLHH